MTRRSLPFLLLLALLLLLPSCGASQAPARAVPAETPAPTAAPTVTPAPTPSPEPTETPAPTPSPEPTETPASTPQPDPTPAPAYTYVLNTNSHKFHEPSCPSVDDMKESNKQIFTGTRDEVVAMGYEPCGRCKP